MGNNYSNWLTQAAQHGISNYEASQMPQAKAAHEQDKAEEAASNKAAKKGDFLATFVQNRSANGGPLGWHDMEEMQSAMADPLYETSEEYRQAVAEITSYTPAEVVGVSASGVAQDGAVIQLGRKQDDGAATVNSMMTNAYRDMVIEHLGKMDLSTARGRYDYMQYLQDPANAEAVAYMEGLVTSDEQQTKNLMLDLKSSGVRQVYETPVTNAIDQPEGSVITERQD